MTTKVNTLHNAKKAQLIYVHDPMCSWCWGYQPTWQLLQHQLAKQLASTLEIIYCVGGLAADSNEAMPLPMQKFLQQTWHKIATQLGTEFNFDFWQQCQPKRSTYPSCRAALIARAHNKEQAMILAIQQGYYLQAKNPSDIETLVELAVSIGFEAQSFLQALQSDEVNQQLIDEIAKVRMLPVNGFPSLVLAVDGDYVAIELDYLHWQTSFEQIKGYLP